jgi:hypothetical protein
VRLSLSTITGYKLEEENYELEGGEKLKCEQSQPAT